MYPPGLGRWRLLLVVNSKYHRGQLREKFLLLSGHDK